MKKFALFSLVLCLGTSGGFAGPWKDVKLGNGNWHLYPSQWNFTEGSYIDCDEKTGAVPDGTFGIQRVSGGFLAKECAIEDGYNQWRDRDIPWCEPSNDKNCKHKATYQNKQMLCIKEEWKQLKSGVQFFLVNGQKTTRGNEAEIRENVACKGCKDGYARPHRSFTVPGGRCTGGCSFTTEECVPEQVVACLKAIDNGDPAANVNPNGCNCGSIDGINYTWKSELGKCVADSKPEAKKTEKKTTPGKTVKPGVCDKYKDNKTALDCCKAGQNWNEKAQKCECVDKEKVWDATNKQCIAKETEPVVEGECVYYFTGSIECANGNQYFEQAEIKLPKSEIGKECGTDILKSDVTRVMDLMKKLCKEKEPEIVGLPGGPSKDEIKQAQNVLSAFTASAKDEASVWKTAEGKFNTTRLASDITAGVVLGTVGGVVTGNIIKKNQVKKGFEALHCTVGGQKVADWGDEFSVGLRR